MLVSWNRTKYPTYLRSASESCAPVSAGCSAGHVICHAIIVPGHVTVVLASAGHVTCHVITAVPGRVTSAAIAVFVRLDHETLHVTVEGGVSIAVERSMVGGACGPREGCVRSN